MATISTTEVAGGATYPFLGGRVWTPNNLTAIGAEPLTVTGSLTAENCEVVVSSIASNTGTLDITNCVLDVSFSGNSNSISGTWNMEDVLITSNGTAYRAWGNWAGGAAVADYDWSNIVFACRVDTDNYLSYNSPFVPKLSATSTFANVSFVYRDRDGGSVGGVTPQLGGNQVWADAAFGGFGLRLNTRQGTSVATDHTPTRVLLRISNQGNSDSSSSTANTQGWFVNPDLRAFEAVDDDTLNCFIMLDNGANSLWINPLMGEPTDSNFFGYVRSPGGGAPTWRMATVTNPSFTDTNSVFTIPSTNLTEAFQVPATLPNTGLVSNGAASNFNAQSLVNPTNGFGFITYAPTTPTILTDTSGWRYGVAVTTAAQNRAIENVAERTYRHYSWLQQQSNDEFGEERTIMVPPFNATDEEVQTARAGGFDQLTVTGINTGWATETDINTPVDTWLAAKSALTTPTLARTEYGTSTTGVTAIARDADDVAVMSKLLAWDSLEGTGVNTTNDKINLPHTASGTALRFATDITLSGSASAPASTAPNAQTLTGLTFPATNITATDRITAIESTGDITLAGTFGSGAGAGKAPINAVSGTLTAEGTQYDNLTLTGATVAFTGTTPAIDNCSIIATTAATFNGASVSGGSVTATGAAVSGLGDLEGTTVNATSVAFDSGADSIDGSTVTTTANIAMPGSTTVYSNNPVLNASGELTSFPVALSGVSINGTLAIDSTARAFTNVSIGVQADSDIGTGILGSGSSFTNCITDSKFTIGQLSNFTISGGTNAFTLTATPTSAATWNISGLTSNDQLAIDLPTAAPTAPITIQTDTAATADVVRAWLTAQGQTEVSSGNGYIIPEARADISFTLGADLPGFLVLQDTTGGTTVFGSTQAEKTLTQGESVSLTLAAADYDDDNEFKYWYAPTSTLETGNNEVVYQPTIGTFSFSDGAQVIPATPVAGVLEDSATAILPGLTYATALSTVTDTNDQITVTISGGNATLSSAAQSLALAITISNEEDVFDAMVASDQDTGPLGFGFNNGAIWQDQGGSATYANAWLRFQSGNTQTVSLPTTADANVNASVSAPAVQLFSNWSNFIPRSNRGVTEISNTPEGVLTSQQAQVALGGVIDQRNVAVAGDIDDLKDGQQSVYDNVASSINAGAGLRRTINNNNV